LYVAQACSENHLSRQVAPYECTSGYVVAYPYFHQSPESQSPKKSVEIKCAVTNQGGKSVVKGVADVLAPSKKQKNEYPQLPEILFS